MKTSGHLKTGEKGEEIASSYLSYIGCEILERNWRAGNYEIDIIARNGNTYIFAEVKSRFYPMLTRPQQAVRNNKQRFLTRAANIYLQKNNIQQEARFDLICILFKKGSGHEIEHIPNAFYPKIGF